MANSVLREQINQAMKDAMRAKDKARLGALRLVQAALKQKEVDERIALTDEHVLAILDKMLKQRRDSISQYQKAERQDLADKEAAEIAVIAEFLPEALSADDLQQLIREAIQTAGAKSMRDMGQVMATLKPKVQGRADMGEVSRILKQALAES